VGIRKYAATGFARRLTQLRREAGLSQLELARLSGVHRTVITRLESGERQPYWVVVVCLAKALGVPTDAFRAEGDFDPAPQPPGESTTGRQGAPP
jgi:transcriptional regulator with XRE-family HTH domain